MISVADRDEKGSWPRSVHEARRFISESLPGSSPVEGQSGDLERYGRTEEPPAVLPARVIEGNTLEAIRVVNPDERSPESGFTGFLDGTQSVEVANYQKGIPILWATVSAGIRVRVDRRMATWPVRGPIVRSGFYIPFKYVSGLEERIRRDARTVDTTNVAAGEKVPSRHPAALSEAAIKKIQEARETAERELAEEWCKSEAGALYVDGSINASAITSQSPQAVGVVKSHNRLYAEGDAFDVLAALKPGERTSIFQFDTPRHRFPVLSWYVRLRGTAGRDALFGLVRVEAAESADMSARADEISRWVITDSLPLALPDGRWDKMAYGVRDTEEFLRAIS